MNFDAAANVYRLFSYFDLVVIPRLGLLYSKHGAARFDATQQTWLPPTTLFYFTQNFDLQDDLFGRFVSHATPTNTETAEENGQQIASNWKRRLAAQETIELSNIGTLYQNHEGEINFLADPASRATNHFGLPKIYLKPLATMQQPPTPLPTTSDTPLVSSNFVPPPDSDATGAAPPPLEVPPPFEAVADRSRSSFGRPIWLALAACLLLGVMVYWRMQKNNKALQEQIANQNTEIAAADSLQEQPALPTPTPLADEDADRRTMAEALPAAAEALPKPTVSRRTEATAAPDADHRTEGAKKGFVTVIVGGFQDAANVRRLMSEIKAAGFQPFKEESTAFTRVGIRFKTTSESAKKARINAIRKRFGRGAWELK